MVTFKDLVQETSTTTGTDNITLDGVDELGQTFNNAFGINTEFDYFIEHATLNEWEAGTATLSDQNTLVRTTVSGSSNNGSKVDFSAGTKYLYNKPTATFLNSLADGGNGGGGVVVPPISSQVPWDRFVAPSGDTTGATDTANLQAALSQPGTVVAASDAEYWINDTIVIDPTLTMFNGGASDFRMVVGDRPAFRIDATRTQEKIDAGYPLNHKQASSRCIEHLNVIGEVNDDLNNIGFLLETQTGYDLSTSACFNNIFIDGFAIGIKFGSNAYINSFTNVRIRKAGLYGLYREIFDNNGENITFNQCTIFECERAFQWHAPNSELRFFGKSFDFNISIGYTDSLVEFVTCHFESVGERTSLKDQFETDNNGTMRFIGCDIGLVQFLNGDPATDYPPRDYLFLAWGQKGHYEFIGTKLPGADHYRVALCNELYAMKDFSKPLDTNSSIFTVISDGGDNLSALGMSYWQAGQQGGKVISPSASDALNRFKRTGYVTTGNAGSTAWIRPSNDQFTTSFLHPHLPAPDDWKPRKGSGGFSFRVTFGISDPAPVTGARMFIGVQKDTNTPADVDPASMTNCIGIAQLDTSSNELYIVYGGTVAQTPIPINNTSAYELIIESDKNKPDVVLVSVINLETDAVFTHAIINNQDGLPQSSVPLRPILWRSNSVNSTPASFDFVRMSATV